MYWRQQVSTPLNNELQLILWETKRVGKSPPSEPASQHTGYGQGRDRQLGEVLPIGSRAHRAPD